MDTSETYIKMCEKAEEIQVLRDMQTLQKGDFYWRSWMGEAVPSRYKHGTEVMCRILDYSSELGGYRCWLPRQDQLQEMVDHPALRLPALLINWLQNEKSYNKEGTAFWKHFDYSSMEQLWLAFVMKEKHSKTWNGKDWIEI